MSDRESTDTDYPADIDSDSSSEHENLPANDFLAPAIILNENPLQSDNDSLPMPILTPQGCSPVPVQHQHKPQIKIMEKLAICRKFGGYPHENGLVFLQEFESFATLHHIQPDERTKNGCTSSPPYRARPYMV